MHCTVGLIRQDLIDQSHWGGPEHVNPLNKNNKWCEVSEWGMCVAPTQFGIDYWLWAMGLGNISRTKFLDNDLLLPKLPEIVVPDGPIRLVKDKN